MTAWWESVVQIRCENRRHGSGFFISPTEVITAAHVLTRGKRVLKPSQFEVNVRYRQVVAPVSAVALLGRWSPDDTGSDIAVIRTAPQDGLGLPLSFGLPPDGTSSLLEATGYDADTDAVAPASGSVECRVSSAGQPFLYSSDFRPVGGMSGGPVYLPLPVGVHVSGVVTRASESHFFGLSLIEALIAELRAQLA